MLGASKCDILRKDRRKAVFYLRKQSQSDLKATVRPVRMCFRRFPLPVLRIPYAILDRIAKTHFVFVQIICRRQEWGGHARCVAEDSPGLRDFLFAKIAE